MAYYKELRDHIKALEEKGKLIRVKREINKDTELYPMVMWQFRGLPDPERKAFLFENVVDVKGRQYDIPVLIASHAASMEIYAMGMVCEPNEIAGKWAHAQRHPIEPILVDRGVVQEEVHKGENLLDHGAIEEFPVPIHTPGFDNAPYVTAGNWITKDPETGIRNVSNSRGMVKSPTRLGVCSLGSQHLRLHWEKCRARGIPLQAAIAIGPTPNVAYVATTKLPYDVDEYAIAGGIAGEPVELVKCLTVDIEVPATAEIVIEGELPTDHVEREAPFGEFTGFMGMEQINPYFNMTCITHRKNPIYNAFVAGFPPNEDSKLRKIGIEAVLNKLLKHDYSLPGVLDVTLQENCASTPYIIIRMKKTYPAEPWQALNATAAMSAHVGKYIIAVDEDIDPEDPDSVNWALSFRVQPHRDTRITIGKEAALDPSAAALTEKERRYPPPTGCSALLIDATRKWDYPPVSLPKREFMERGRQLWEEEGLPPLRLKTPWYGYSSGFWSKENELEAELALKGEHYRTGEKLAQGRKKI